MENLEFNGEEMSDKMKASILCIKRQMRILDPLFKMVDNGSDRESNNPMVITIVSCIKDLHKAENSLNSYMSKDMLVYEDFLNIGEIFRGIKENLDVMSSFDISSMM